jgi:hypothetical protein
MDGEDASHPVLATASLRDWFRDHLAEAETQQKIGLDEATREYVLQVLESFSGRDATITEELEDLSNEPISMQLMRAMQAPPGRRFQMMRHIGDYSLYLTGFFVDSISRTHNDEQYFVQIGSTAYRGAACALPRGESNPFRTLYDGLSTRFGDLVGLLNDVSERCFRGEQDVLRLYDRFAATGSRRLATRLAHLGVAVSVGTRSTH